MPVAVVRASVCADFVAVVVPGTVLRSTQLTCRSACVLHTRTSAGALPAVLPETRHHYQRQYGAAIDAVGHITAVALTL
jgi:hypothetical protein